ncbi:toprim domain-containing protein [Proteiniphilum propionicum]|uniref:toprim domain-containing protein n=1 Tax=Proteiniphilum propionicum TaxID=2829812 RepID=UPI001EEC4443|nr:toprim domain-containing protein [Proteiniphilum propionicum]ULB33176.1 toprim domain-containing protein [Proteiniphilum propionicum]
MEANNVKEISIKGYLAEQGIYPIKEYPAYGMYLSPYRNEGHPSFKVNYRKNLWRDFGAGEGGSIIDLVMKMRNCSDIEAIKLLEEKADLPLIVKTAFPSESESVGRMKLIRVEQFLPPHLENYLVRERAIPLEQAKRHLSTVYYSVKERVYYAIGFKNDKAGYELRNSQFKGCFPPKTITTIDRGTPTCNLFEGFMDFLSYLTLYPMKEKDHPTESAVVLNGTGNLEKVIPFLSKHTQVYAYLDNDEAGKEALQKLIQLKLPITDCSKMYVNHKDLNEFLKQMKGQKVTQIIPKSRRMKL